MEITLKVVLSADANFLAALQALTAGPNRQAVKDATLALNYGTEATPTMVPELAQTPEKKPRKVKEVAAVPEADNAKFTININEGAANGTKVETTHTLDSLREIAVPLSKAGHKDAIKEKIASFGYESIAFMEPKDFDAFYAFLQTLN